eukprot:1045275-Amphidinium_carterae.1
MNLCDAHGQNITLEGERGVPMQIVKTRSLKRLRSSRLAPSRRTCSALVSFTVLARTWCHAVMMLPPHCIGKWHLLFSKAMVLAKREEVHQDVPIGTTCQIDARSHGAGGSEVLSMCCGPDDKLLRGGIGKR